MLDGSHGPTRLYNGPRQLQYGAAHPESGSSTGYAETSPSDIAPGSHRGDELWDALREGHL